MNISLGFLFALFAIVALIAATALLLAGKIGDATVVAVLFVGLVLGAVTPLRR